MTDKRPVIPLPGNAFSQQAYRDSLKATEEPGSPTGQDTSEKKPLPEAPQVHTVDRDSSGSSGSEKKPGDSKTFLLFGLCCLTCLACLLSVVFCSACSCVIPTADFLSCKL